MVLRIKLLVKDAQIVTKSGILEKALPGEEWMVDKGFPLIGKRRL